jgi:hypothetical protein
MAKVRATKLKLQASKPRNPVVAGLALGTISGKAGRHQKSRSAQRQQAKKDLQQERRKLGW